MNLKWVAAQDLPAIGAYLISKFPEMEGAVGSYVPHAAVIFTDDQGEVRGALSLKLLTTFDGALSLYAEPGFFPSIKQLRQLFVWAFTEAGLVRLSSNVARSNKHARRMNELMGFRLEGVKRLGYDGRQSACIYGMTKDSCRWLKRHQSGLS